MNVGQEGTNAEVTAKLPVAEMIGWSNDLRSTTEGKGTSSILDQSHQCNIYKNKFIIFGHEARFI